MIKIFFSTITINIAVAIIITIIIIIITINSVFKISFKEAVLVAAVVVE